MKLIIEFTEDELNTIETALSIGSIHTPNEELAVKMRKLEDKLDLIQVINRAPNE